MPPETPANTPRLGAQAARVWAVFHERPRQWLSLSDLSRLARAPEASVSARIREVRRQLESGGGAIRTAKCFGGWLYCAMLDASRPAPTPPNGYTLQPMKSSQSDPKSGRKAGPGYDRSRSSSRPERYGPPSRRSGLSLDEWLVSDDDGRPEEGWFRVGAA